MYVDIIISNAFNLNRHFFIFFFFFDVFPGAIGKSLCAMSLTMVAYATCNGCISNMLWLHKQHVMVATATCNGCISNM